MASDGDYHSPTTFELVVNLKTARSLGVTVPHRLTGMTLVRLPRLSVQPVTEAEWRIVCQMGGLG